MSPAAGQTPEKPFDVTITIGPDGQLVDGHQRIIALARIGVRYVRTRGVVFSIESLSLAQKLSAMHADLRRVAIAPLYTGESGRMTITGRRCRVCLGEWGVDAGMEFHAETCTAKP